jgi:hypothetical protein
VLQSGPLTSVEGKQLSDGVSQFLKEVKMVDHSLRAVAAAP